MQLSEGLFREIVGDDRAPVRGVGPGAERRRVPRFALPIATDVFPIRQGRVEPAVPIRVRDVSVLAIAFSDGELLAAMAVQDELIIRLPRQAGESVWVRCQITHCRPPATPGHCVTVVAEFRDVVAN